MISIGRGFLTSFLNPKGLLVYLAILPQFINPESNTADQALILSALFIAGCAIIYTFIALLTSTISKKDKSSKIRRRFEMAAGGLLLTAAVKLAIQV